MQVPRMYTQSSVVQPQNTAKFGLREIFIGYFVSQLSRDCILQIFKNMFKKSPKG